MSKSERGRAGESRLRASLRCLGRNTSPLDEQKRAELDAPRPLSLDPSNAFEVAVAEQIRALRDDVDELKERLNWLFGLIIAAAVANVVLAFVS
jgi:hypothetical protein